MIFNKCIIFLLFLTSCTSIGEHVDSLIIKTGKVRTASNQDYEKLIKEKNFFLIGYLNIYYDDININKRCTVSINYYGDGILLDESGEVIFSTPQKENYLYYIRCARGDENPFFQYTFDNVSILSNGEDSYFGEIDLHITLKKKNDLNNKYKNAGPWIKKIIYLRSEDKRNKIEKKYSLKSYSEAVVEFK